MSSINENIISNYKEAFFNLITEKTDDQDLLKEKADKAFQLALSISTFVGDEEFNALTKRRLKKICETKPGRVLIKALATSEFVKRGYKITFAENNEFKLDEATVLSIRKPDIQMNAIDSEGKPILVNSKAYILIAHELVHLLHVADGRSGSNPLLDEECFDLMDNLEEQHTIVGINHKSFASKKTLTKTDVLCENAFNLFIQGSPRIDHQGISHGERAPREVHLRKENKEVGYNVKLNEIWDSYENWINDQLNAFVVTPGKEDDRVFMRRAIKKSFGNFQLASDRLINDSLFWANLFEDHSLGKFGSILIKMPEDLFKRSDFAIEIINNTIKISDKLKFLKEESIYMDEMVVKSLLERVLLESESFAHLAQLKNNQSITKEVLGIIKINELGAIRQLLALIEKNSPELVRENENIAPLLSRAREAFYMDVKFKTSQFGSECEF